MSPLLSCRASAVRGLIIAALSQVSDVSGFGSSCSHPLFAKRPSQIVGSRRKMISSPVAAGAAAAAAAIPGCRVTVLGAACVPGMMPLICAWYQNLSNSGGIGAAADGYEGCDSLEPGASVLWKAVPGAGARSAGPVPGPESAAPPPPAVVRPGAAARKAGAVHSQYSRPL